MKRTTLVSLFVLSMVLALVAACGHDRNGAAPRPTTATVKLSTAGALATGVQIGALDVTAALPDGITVRAVPDSINSGILLTDDGVVTATGAAGAGTTALSGVYTAATSTVPGALRIVLVNVPGFGTGEFCTVTADISADAVVTAADVISLVTVTAHDESGNVISGLTTTFTAVLQ